MASYKQGPVHNNQYVKARNTIFYPLASAQANNNNERRIFETKFALRQNIHNVKPTIPIIYRLPNTTTCKEHKNVNPQQKVLQFPGYSNPTSPRVCTSKQEIDGKKLCQSLGNSPVKQQIAQHNENEYLQKNNTMITSLSLSPQRQQQQQQEKKIQTLIVPFQSPQNKMKKTLILDLDETLIHSSQMKPKKYDLNFNIQTSTTKEEFFVKFRPNVSNFLRIMANYYEVFIWTASIKEYADVIINQLDPSGSFISYRLYRDSCRKKGDYYIKDLALLNRNMKDVIIIDNLSTCFNLHQENGIQIQDFTNDETDNELEKLTPFLIFASDVNDVRDVFKWKIKFENQSHFEFKNMQNQNKIYINQSKSNELTNSNIQQIAPYFIQSNHQSEVNDSQPNKQSNQFKVTENIQQRLIQKNQLNQSYQVNQNKNDQCDQTEMGEDYIYRSRRSVSNSLENSQNISKCDQFSKIVNLEHSFGGNQNNNGDNQINPIFQEFTFSKLKIEESRVVEEVIGKNTERVIEKINNSNKHERIPFKQIDCGNQSQINYSPQFNFSQTKNSSHQIQGYHHSLQPTVFKLIEQPVCQNSNPQSNRQTPSFERKRDDNDNKENKSQLQNAFQNIQKGLQEIIQDQKNQKSYQKLNNIFIKPIEQNNLDVSKTNQKPVILNQSSQNIDNNTRTNFQKSRYSAFESQGNKEEQANMLKIDDNLNQRSCQIQEQKEMKGQITQSQVESQKQKEDCNFHEFNIYEDHPIPKFLQLPSRKIEKKVVLQQNEKCEQKQFTFQAAKTQCEMHKQAQGLSVKENKNEILERLSNKQQNKEVPQIKKDLSIQSISIEFRRHTLDTIQSNKNNNQSNLEDQQKSQQSKYPKIFDQNVPQKIPVIGNHIQLSKYKPLSQQETSTQAQIQVTDIQLLNTNNQEKMIKSLQCQQAGKDHSVDQNNTSLQNIQHNQQEIIQPKRHYSQYVSSNQILENQQPQKSNYQFIKSILKENQCKNDKNKENLKQNQKQLIDQCPQQHIQILKQNKNENQSPILIQNNQLLFNVKPYLVEKQNTLEQKTPSTASHSKYNSTIEDGSSKKEKLFQFQNHVQSFEEYTNQGSKFPQVISQKKVQFYNPNQISNKNNRTFAQFESYIQQIQ
ncbi:NLI interacting factor-like phosphatase (macronuclear) [Tetrahymena thermophila SB210]|uniref:NLI interacting factor-like phosphatase n=1 Tax=Tetrahymena thermophila (strain SB210) TaxID=312017 RepID=I7MEQ1_TETTS|nr:NLI interacting factor-like phosphatase [Tetrahymena thermophila SB210]EAR97348.1 NLI interacting factor-like phosphatase [Tetrahymena thermophila SB210]|eukprot:XP_001017593.1 NLI interacting factor-like phosphatase [Tetrahymena thermophila SB210]